MSLLFGTTIASEIKSEHKERVQKLVERGIAPHLAIVTTGGNEVIDLYIRLKQKYATDIGASVDVYQESIDSTVSVLNRLSLDQTVTGIIVQLPLSHPEKTDEILSHIAAEKDIDALLGDTFFVPATPQAILWILEKNNIFLNDKKIVLIGKGRLVGMPLAQLFDTRGISYTAYEKGDAIVPAIAEADVVITATGTPNLITNAMVKTGTVIVDAGTAVEAGVVVGDVEEAVRTREDIQITPTKGGVGPLTICALFENLLIAAEKNSNIL